MNKTKLSVAKDLFYLNYITQVLWCNYGVLLRLFDVDFSRNQLRKSIDFIKETSPTLYSNLFSSFFFKIMQFSPTIAFYLFRLKLLLKKRI